MDSSHETTKIDYGNDFRMIHGSIYSHTKDLIKSGELNFQDMGLLLYLCEYMKPYSTEIDISISKFAEEYEKSKGYLSKQINKLIQYNLIIKKDGKLYINLKYATRGNEVYKYIYNISSAEFNVKEHTVKMEKEKEENIHHELGF